MCLYISNSATRHLKGRMKKTGSIICYKELVHVHAPIFYLQYQAGWNISDRPSINLLYDEKRGGEVNKGIHVYVSKKVAQQRTNRKLIPVRCYLKDLVKAGRNSEAVFMKVFITKKDWKKHVAN